MVLGRLGGQDLANHAPGHRCGELALLQASGTGVVACFTIVRHSRRPVEEMYIHETT
jgi:hypothetical protein